MSSIIETDWQFMLYFDIADLVSYVSQHWFIVSVIELARILSYGLDLNLSLTRNGAVEIFSMIKRPFFFFLI